MIPFESDPNGTRRTRQKFTPVLRWSADHPALSGCHFRPQSLLELLPKRLELRAKIRDLVAQLLKSFFERRDALSVGCA